MISYCWCAAREQHTSWNRVGANQWHNPRSEVLEGNKAVRWLSRTPGKRNQIRRPIVSPGTCAYLVQITSRAEKTKFRFPKHGQHGSFPTSSRVLRLAPTTCASPGSPAAVLCMHAIAFGFRHGWSESHLSDLQHNTSSPPYFDTTMTTN